MFSEAGTINCAVPKGFFLEASLFLLYINDILQTLPESHTYLYSDNIKQFRLEYEEFAEIENVLNKEFENMCKRCVVHTLSIHFDENKTKYVLFSKEKT